MIKRFIVILAFWSIFTGCATDVTSYTFTQSRFFIPEGELGLAPGQSYSAEFWIATELSSDGIHKETRWIRNAVWKNTVIECLDPEITVTGNVIKTAGLDLSKLTDKSYVFNLKLLNNPHPIAPIERPKLWSSGKMFLSQVGASEHGPEMTIETAYYDVSGTSLEGTGTYHLVHQIGTQNVALVKSTEFPIHVSARGGNGRPGRDGQSYTLRNGETDVYGERGERGEDGGDGGKIVILTANQDPSIKAAFDLNVEGGDGGAGGKGGTGDTADKGLLTLLGAMSGGIHRGSDGSPGRKGHRGEVEWQTVEPESLFTDLTIPGFDRKRLGVRVAMQSEKN